MSHVVTELTATIDRLRRANIPADKLCYLLDDREWQEFAKFVQGFGRYQDLDLSYVNEVTYMGIRVRRQQPNQP